MKRKSTRDKTGEVCSVISGRALHWINWIINAIMYASYLINRKWICCYSQKADIHSKSWQVQPHAYPRCTHHSFVRLSGAHSYYAHQKTIVQNISMYVRY
jgi:hypothetical protein